MARESEIPQVVMGVDDRAIVKLRHDFLRREGAIRGLLLPDDRIRAVSSGTPALPIVEVGGRLWPGGLTRAGIVSSRPDATSGRQARCLR